RSEIETGARPTLTRLSLDHHPAGAQISIGVGAGDRLTRVDAQRHHAYRQVDRARPRTATVIAAQPRQLEIRTRIILPDAVVTLQNTPTRVLLTITKTEEIITRHRRSEIETG